MNTKSDSKLGSSSSLGASTSTSYSSRPPQRAAARHVLDSATRQRRARKALESLERDNFHDDPHAGLVMSKKALSLFQDEEEPVAKKSRRKTRTAEYYRQRFRKNFAQLLEEDAVVNKNDLNNGGDNGQQTSSSEQEKPKQPIGYLSAQAPPSSRPPRRFCAVCGFPSLYSCTICGTRYCSLRCQETHMETRCLKWTV